MNQGLRAHGLIGQLSVRVVMLIVIAALTGLAAGWMLRPSSSEALKSAAAATRADVRLARQLEVRWLGERSDERRLLIERELLERRRMVMERLAREATRPSDVLLAVQTVFKRFTTAQDDALASARSLQSSFGVDAVATLAQGRSAQAYDELIDGLEAWQLDASSASRPGFGSSTDANVAAALVVLISMTLVAGLATLRWFVGAVNRPIQQATNALQALARGDSNFRLTIDCLDETRHLLLVIDRFREVLLSVADDDDCEATPSVEDDRQRGGSVRSAVVIPERAGFRPGLVSTAL